MVFDGLIGYPNLRQLEDLLGNPDPRGTSYIASLARVKASSGISFVIDGLERCVGILLSRWTVADFKEQADAVFGPTLDDLDKALTEMLGLASFEADGTLASIGYPPGSYTPPFEGVIADATSGKQIAFDVKSASGSGMFLLQGKIREAAEMWAAANGYGKVDVNLFCDGPVPQQVMAEYMKKRITQAFSTMLAGSSTFPPKDFTTVLHGNTIRVQVRPASGAMMNMRAIPRGATAAVFANVIAEHAKKKAKQAGKHSVPFLLVYCRPSTAGMSDLRPEDLPSATFLAFESHTKAGTPDMGWWLGCLYLDFTQGPEPRRMCQLLPGRAYPEGSTQASVNQTLRCG